MYNPQPSMQAGHTPGKAPKGQDAFVEERVGNEQIRELLRTFGLRTSLIRLKVIDALHVADRNGRSIGVRGVHAQLEQLDIPLSFLSVREVLKRLCAEGVINLGSDKCYSLNPQARAVLDQTAPR
ncbi:fe2+ zn2+ uptake regulation protein [Pseudomonas sp. SWRI59]|uniref:fe2+ zn2+ uptake regulation protein n=1 Tax=Pseudomonas TaxID=286 RepID=UPI0016460172|nr:MULTISPECIES: fe2+ zn2+ uptake regulation protein [unclassified Pseudomonas]MBC3480812.1 fe2+ zn2+ uptake regulation protein [Pseudomonas sp. SWRI77]MBC3503390.1 fe2+ zn2+ uptake regulation protein [Pseudomonas sp. SWRI59]MBC3508805.1 fe2+ zn2+ uptake regulation protein [Pseudomonas sp. SWRI68]UVL01610.1 fe2+ zn2+ uptake regulation protein [Pseudomonas sp. B21-047]